MDDKNINDADAVLLHGVEEDSGEQCQQEYRVGLETADDLLGQEIVGEP